MPDLVADNVRNKLAGRWVTERLGTDKGKGGLESFVRVRTAGVLVEHVEEGDSTTAACVGVPRCVAVRDQCTRAVCLVADVVAGDCRVARLFSRDVDIEDGIVLGDGLPCRDDDALFGVREAGRTVGGEGGVSAGDERGTGCDGIRLVGRSRPITELFLVVASPAQDRVRGRQCAAEGSGRLHCGYTGQCGRGSRRANEGGRGDVGATGIDLTRRVHAPAFRRPVREGCAGGVSVGGYRDGGRNSRHRRDTRDGGLAARTGRVIPCVAPTLNRSAVEGRAGVNLGRVGDERASVTRVRSQCDADARCG